MEHESTKREILEAINVFATHMEERWQENERRWDANEKRWEKAEERFHRIELKLVKMDATLDKVVSQTMEIQEWRAEVAPKLARL